MNHRHSGLVAIAGLALAATAAPALAQNTATTIDNAASDVGNTASDIGNATVDAANRVGTAAGNAVDVDVTTTAGENAAAGTTGASTDVNGMEATDANMTAMEPMNDLDTMATTTTTTERQSDGKGNWGLLGLAGLLGFLFRPKKQAIHLDERHNTTRV